MAKKFLRGLPVTQNNGREAAAMMKILYEFWGYCVNGGASLTTPGGFPTTPSNLPTNFLEGTNVLATGSDGVTVLDGNTFSSASNPFLSTHVGKLLVIWKANSGSSEDSIYEIKGFTNSGQITVNVLNGGTPGSNLHPHFTARTAINFRVIDTSVSLATTVVTGHYLVFTFSGASGVNTGQASSQVQMLIRQSTTLGDRAACVISPGGTWTGSAFTDGTTEQSTMSGGSSGAAASLGYMNIAADKDFFYVHYRSTTSNGFVWFVEIPTRLYAQASDTNPVVVLLDSADSGSPATNFWSLSTGSRGFYNNMLMVGSDGTVRRQKLLLKCLQGERNNAAVNSGAIAAFGTLSSDPRTTFSNTRQKILASEGLLSCSGTAGQYYLSRVKLRNVRFVNSGVPPYYRVGDSGEFLHIVNGVCVPWDNTILPLIPYALGT